jgi:hypothetical protein
MDGVFGTDSSAASLIRSRADIYFLMCLDSVNVLWSL